MYLAQPTILRHAATLVVVFSCLPTFSQAQYGGPSWRPRPWQEIPVAELTLPKMVREEPSHQHPLLLVAGGLAGYAVTRGMFEVTEHLAEGERNCGTGFCLSTMTVVASALAAPTLVPLGVHLANRGRGDLGANVLASTTVGLGVLLIGARSGMSAEELLIAIPVGQIVAAVAAEIMVSRRPRAPPEP